MKYLTDYETKAAYDAAKKDLPKPQIALVRDSYNVHFAPNKVGPEYDKEYFTIVAKESGTVTFVYPATTQKTSRNDGDPYTSISYSRNGGDWVTTEYDEHNGNIIEISVSSGDKVRWKGINHTMCVLGEGDPLYMSNFTSNCLVDVEGNIMSLLFGDDFIGETSLEGREDAFALLFVNDGGEVTTLQVVSAENLILPATTLVQGCYASMFMGCTSLTTAPQLPATTLVQYCYESMFMGCTSLTEAPQLPATTLYDLCYAYMFYGCTSLTTAPQLPATTLSYGCYAEMFNRCTSLTTAPQLPATTLTDYCYASMFMGCTSLTTAPQLLATTLAEWCYSDMFNGCSQLNYIKCLATDISATNCTSNWVLSVASNGTFIRDANTSWGRGDSGIPYGWEVEPPLSDIEPTY